MVGGTRALALLAASLVLAGCAESAAEPESKPLQASQEAPKPATVLRVLVITDEFLPIGGAKVNVVGLGLNSTTDDVGNAYFQIGKPGRYSLHVHHTRFYPNVTKVTVEGDPNQVTRVTLRDAPRDAHFSDFYFFQGQCGPTAHVPGATDSECADTPFLTRAYPHWFLTRGLQSGHFILEWNMEAYGVETMWLEIGFPEAGDFRNGETFLRTEGTSPVKVVIPAELVTEPMRANGVPISMRIGIGGELPADANFYQDFLVEAQLNYYVVAPDVDPEA